MAPWGLFHIWLWWWFTVGAFVYWLKRAYFLVTGPNPVAVSYTQFVERCWIPLLVRASVDAGIYWATFYPDIFNFVFKFSPWPNIQLHSPFPQYGLVAFWFGMGIDSVVDFGVTKIPWLKDLLPQMPAPLKTVSPTDRQIADDKASK